MINDTISGSNEESDSSHAGRSTPPQGKWSLSLVSGVRAEQHVCLMWIHRRRTETSQLHVSFYGLVPPTTPETRSSFVLKYLVHPQNNNLSFAHPLETWIHGYLLVFVTFLRQNFEDALCVSIGSNAGSLCVHRESNYWRRNLSKTNKIKSFLE